MKTICLNTPKKKKKEEGQDKIVYSISQANNEHEKAACTDTTGSVQVAQPGQGRPLAGPDDIPLSCLGLGRKMGSEMQYAASPVGVGVDSSNSGRPTSLGGVLGWHM